MDVGVGLPVLRGEPRPAAERLRRVETADVADLGHEDRGEDVTDTVDGLDGVVAGVVAEDEVDVAVQKADLALVDLDQVSEHGDAVEVGVGELERVELGVAARSPHVISTREDPVLGHDRVDWALRPVRRLDNFIRKRTISRSSRVSGGAIHASARRPRRNRSARSRASRSSFFTRRCPQSLPCGLARWTVAHFFEEIDRPVPAIGRLDDDVAADWGGTDLFGEVARFVVDPDRVDLLSGLVHPIDDRPSAVQVDADVLFCHRGLPCRGVWCEQPQSRPRDRSRHGERRPRSFMPSLRG